MVGLECLCMYTCICRYPAHLCIHIHRPKVNIQCLPLSLSTLVFENESLIKPKACCFNKISWPVNSWEQPAFCLPMLILCVYAAIIPGSQCLDYVYMLLYLGSRHSSSFLHIKHFTHLATSQSLSQVFCFCKCQPYQGLKLLVRASFVLVFDHLKLLLWPP